MVKRRAETVTDNRAEGSEAIKSSNAKRNRNTDDEIERLLQLGKKYRDDDEAEYNPFAISDAARSAQWLEVLAQHLAREPQFLDIMENPQDPLMVHMSKKWLASVHLAGRWKVYSTFSSFFIGWWNKDKDRQVRMIERAMDIVENAFHTTQTEIQKTSILPPPNDDNAKQLRQDIFHYHTLRSRTVATLQNSLDQQYLLVNKLFTLDDTATGMADSVREEMQMLEDLRVEIADYVCGASTVDRMGAEVLDELLNQTPQRGPAYLEVAADGSIAVEALVASTASADGDTSRISIDEKVRRINEQSPFNIHYYGSETAGAKDMIYIRSPAGVKAVMMEETPQIDQLASVGGLSDLDEKLTASIKTSASGVTLSQFQANMAHFEAVQERPSRIQKAKSNSNIFKHSHEYLLVIDDNLFHIKVLAGKLCQHGLLRADVTDVKLEEHLRRMWALLSIMHGCAAEGSLWLTVMDSLLNNLSRLLIGQVEARFNTAKLVHLRSMHKQDGNAAEAPKLSTEQIEGLERADRARQLFAEIARFYRGTVLLAYMGVSWGHKLTDKSGADWYDNLIRWSYICRLESCGEELRVQTVQKEEEVGDEEDDDEEEGPEMLGGDLGFANGEAFGSRSKYHLSIGVLDARIGAPDERADISSNRSFSYGCLYTLIHTTKWHAGFGPFFHYFAHLFHHPCKAARGKDDFVSTILAAAEEPN